MRVHLAHVGASVMISGGIILTSSLIGSIVAVCVKYDRIAKLFFYFYVSFINFLTKLLGTQDERSCEVLQVQCDNKAPSSGISMPITTLTITFKGQILISLHSCQQV